SSMSMQGAAAGARRVLEILDAPTAITESRHALEISHIQGHVRLEGVNFGYDAGVPVLQDVSLDVPAGQTLALVGGSGGVKTPVWLGRTSSSSVCPQVTRR